MTDFEFIIYFKCPLCNSLLINNTEELNARITKYCKCGHSHYIHFKLAHFAVLTLIINDYRFVVRAQDKPYYKNNNNGNDDTTLTVSLDVKQPFAAKQILKFNEIPKSLNFNDVDDLLNKIETYITFK